MNYSIKWSPASKEEYANLLTYVEDNFGIDAALKLLDKTDKVIEGIAKFPEMFPASKKKKSVRKAVITKQNALLYRIKKKEVQLLHFWDNRMNPGKLNKLIS